MKNEVGSRVRSGSGLARQHADQARTRRGAFCLAEFVARSAAASDVPVRMQDPEALSAVAELLCRSTVPAPSVDREVAVVTPLKSGQAQTIGATARAS